MLIRIANRIMRRRAQRLFRRLQKHLPSQTVIADIGSGSGHNGETIRQQTDLKVLEFDVEDLHWVGPAPQIFSGSEIPRGDESVDGVLLLFVLQYPRDPARLLNEARRVTSGPLLVLQSTYDGALAYAALRVREFVFGRLGFYLARFFGIVSTSTCPLMPQRYLTREELFLLFDSAGLSVDMSDSESSLFFSKLRRELFVLRRNAS